ncbi:MAG: hypothetical protein M0C28_29195 [Candidatus Moduliflexus flocculans]|nr:hypothetical protein [Candidatus Moduliflexus flocculans]
MNHYTTQDRVMVAYVPARGVQDDLRAMVGDLFGWLAVDQGLSIIAGWAILLRGRRTGQREMLQVEIRFKGQVGEQWSERFGGLTVSLSDPDETVLTGLVADPSAHCTGSSPCLRDLGLQLTSVNSEEIKENFQRSLR